MEMSLTRNLHATAFPGRDALCALPVARATSKQTGSLNPRKPLFIGSWNVRTLLDVGSQALTVGSLHDYRVDIACLSECRIPGCGSQRIKVPGTEAYYWLYHSGPLDNSGQQGVALALNHRANSALLSWRPISPRILVARFKGHPMNITIISVYAPTLPSERNLKDDFYDALHAVVGQVPKRDILIVAGDWNARTGPGDEYNRHILGRHAVGDRCENGDRLISFAEANRLCVANTRFQHPRKHLLTWYSNDGRTASQIDYILIRSRWMSSVDDCRAYRGAEAGNKGGSDHVLLRAKLRLRLSTRKKTVPPKRINTAPLEGAECCRTLCAEIENQLSNSPGSQTVGNDSVDAYWSKLKSSVRQAAFTVLGSTSRPVKDWISPGTIRLASKAKEARIANSLDYRCLRREVTRSARHDRKRYWSDMAASMEAAAHNGNIGQLFRLIRQASGKRYTLQPTLRSSEGQLIPDVAGKVTRWVEHFSKLLNRPPCPSLEVSTARPPYDVNYAAPTISEIASVIGLMKSKKAPGADGIPAEVYKSCLPTLLPKLHQLFCLIWEAETCPSDWSTSVLLPVPKKGDKSICSNYRGISLIDVAAKAFARLLLSRFANERNSRTRPNQGGFRPGRGCIDQIFILRRVLEHRHKFQQPTFVCFIDFRAAFDSIDRESLWRLLAADGIPGKLINLMRSYYASTKARVRIYGEESQEFALNSGVRQGCPLSPVLFNFAVDWVMQHALVGYRGVQVSPDLWLSDLEFADDIVILAEDHNTLQSILDRVARSASMVGLDINASKTKYFSSTAAPATPLIVNGQSVEQVPAFKYLGSTILPNGQAKDEIKARSDTARAAFMQLRKALWRRSEISLRTKMRVYSATIRPILLYGCETWPMRSEDCRKLEVLDHWCLRYISKVRRLDRISNDDVRSQCFNIMKLSDYIRRRRLQWFGHVLRKPDSDLAKAVLAPPACPNWRRRQGGQLKTWIDTVKADAEGFGLEIVYGVRRWKTRWIEICAEFAANRDAWAAAIRDIPGAGSSSRRR